VCVCVCVCVCVWCVCGVCVCERERAFECDLIVSTLKLCVMGGVPGRAKWEGMG
jgi:hypothetical protein